MEYFRRHSFLLSSYCRRPPTLTDTQQVENSEHKVDIKIMDIVLWPWGKINSLLATKNNCTNKRIHVVKHGKSYSLKKYTVDICSFCTNIGFAGFNHFWAMLECPWPSVSDWPWCWNADDYTLWLKHYAGWDFTYYGMQFDCCGGDTRYSARI